MTKHVPGHAVYSGLTHPFELGPDANPGDFVALVDGVLTPTDANRSIGILSDQAAGYDAGDLADVHLSGIVIGNVAAGVTAGDGLGDPDTAGGDTAGEAAAGGDRFTAVSDEGGQYRMHETVDKTLDAGYGAVHLGN